MLASNSEELCYDAAAAPSVAGTAFEERTVAQPELGQLRRCLGLMLLDHPPNAHLINTADLLGGKDHKVILVPAHLINASQSPVSMLAFAKPQHGDGVNPLPLCAIVFTVFPLSKQLEGIFEDHS